MARHYWKSPLKYIGYGGMGKQVRDILHVDDLVRLVDMQIHDIRRFQNKIYNAGGGLQNSASLLEMTAICEKITGNKITISREQENRPADLRLFITNHSQLTESTGWRPQKSVEDVFVDIFAWIGKNEKQLKTILHD
jgi:CDP-paratose 2-epimerase